MKGIEGYYGLFLLAKIVGGYLRGCPRGLPRGARIFLIDYFGMSAVGIAARRSKSTGAPVKKVSPAAATLRTNALATACSSSTKVNLGRRAKSTSPASSIHGHADASASGSVVAQASAVPLCGPKYRDWLSDLDAEKLVCPPNEAPTVGLMNNGNMCFLNAVVQSLIHTPMLRHYLSLCCSGVKEEWLSELVALYRQIEANRLTKIPISASKLASLLFLASTTDEFRRGAQADAHEAFMLIIAKLLEGCLSMTGVNCSAISFPDKEKLERGSVVGHVYGMDVLQTVRCNSCSY